MRDEQGGRTGKMARMTRQHKAELALFDEANKHDVILKVVVHGSGRGSHIIEVQVHSVPDRFIKNGWTIADFKTAEACRFEDWAIEACKKACPKEDAISFDWLTGAFENHMERMKGYRKPALFTASIPIEEGQQFAYDGQMWSVKGMLSGEKIVSANQKTGFCVYFTIERFSEAIANGIVQLKKT